MNYYKACDVMCRVWDFIYAVETTRGLIPGDLGVMVNLQIIGVDPEQDRCFIIPSEGCRSPEDFLGYELETNTSSETLDDIKEENGELVYMSEADKDYYTKLDWGWIISRML